MVILVGFFLMISLLACGKKANPIIPVKVTPNGIENLSYLIKGKTLIVFWGIPKQNTDGSPLTDLKGFRVQKGEWPTKDVCATCPDQFQQTLWIDLKGPELPDIRIEPDQVQLSFNRLTPGRTYFFQVTAVTKKEAASKPSKTLRLPWELPLAPPSALQVKSDRKGLVISWNPSLTLIDGTPAVDLAGYTLERRMEKGSWQKLNTEPIMESNYLDSELQENVTYAYRVKALRRIQENILESELSEEKEILFTRTTPPPPVQDLMAIVNPSGVELRWQAIETETPSGYHVYRRLKGEKTAVRITSKTVQDTQYEDRQVKPGTTYWYSVSAVGSAPALREGPRSIETEITFNP